MKHFNEFLNEGLHDESQKLTDLLVDLLKDGIAICVKIDDVEIFLSLLKNETWMKKPLINSFIGGENIRFKNQNFYFVLFNDRLLHTDKPEFGGYKFEVYTFDKNQK